MTLPSLSRSAVLTATAFTLAVGTAPAATAQPITFTFAGAASGTFNGTAFTNAPFVFTLSADLATSPYVNTGVAQYPNLDGTTVTVGGVLPTAAILSGVRLINNPFNGILDFGAGLSYIDIRYTPGVGPAATYDLRSDFGPFGGTSANVGPAFNNIAVTGGFLTFDRVSDVSFRATVGVSAVPEPATLALVGSGLLCVGVAARRRRA